jgi:hypothetical protein
MPSCPVCRAESPPGNRFCGACGAPLGVDPSLTRTTPPEEQLPVRVVSGPVPTPSVRARLASDADGLAPGTVLAARYRVVNLVGQGGMGEVYRADDLTLGQPVALKFLPRTIDPHSDRFARFLAEVRTARQVSHPNVCRVYDIVQSEGRTFLAMEYIDGEDLSSLLRRIGRLPSDKATEIARQLCAGLAAAHDKGVLHRDLKPANVMLDSRGRARLTDFGLAGAEDVELGLAGTPAYMAPEQLHGEPASMRSEVYALGLVLYELFTGHRLFDASSIAALRDLHDRTDVTALSTGLTEVDPAVDRVIRRCLDRDPSKRPASALAVAAALPGGDPLAAALAAGETPAPALVAAAGGEGALRPAVAVALLSAVVLLLPLCAALKPRAALYPLLPVDPPDALASQARDLLRRVVNADPPADTARGFYRDDDVVQWMTSQGRASMGGPSPAGGRPSPFGFWFRDSPALMAPVDAGAGVISTDDPPMTTSGMRLVRFDARGRLLELTVVPPQVDPDAADANVPAPDWAPLFGASGLDPSKFTPAPPRWIPPFAFDRRASWSGPAPERRDITLRIDAASYRGRPVWFGVFGPWSRPARQVALPATAGERASNILLAVIFLLLLAVCVALARRNLRLGRGDRQGAWRLAMCLFAVGMLSVVLGSVHVPTFYELYWFVLAVGANLFVSALIGATYLALEPIVRRRWPHVIIGWSRVLSGRISDARVGRDLLVGVAAGLLIPTGQYLFFRWYPPSLPRQLDLISLPELESLRSAMANLSGHLIGSIYLSLAICLIYVASYSVMRRHWLTGAALVGIFAALDLLFFDSLPAVVSGVLINTVILIVLTQLGLLAAIASSYTLRLVTDFPMTTDFAQWHASTGLIGIVVILALAVWAFRTSLGGQALLKEA